MNSAQEAELLAAEIAEAAQSSFRSLSASGGRYYYCTLYTTGEGHVPSLSAWSHEALEQEAARQAEGGSTPVSTTTEQIK